MDLLCNGWGVMQTALAGGRGTWKMPSQNKELKLTAGKQEGPNSRLPGAETWACAAQWTAQKRNMDVTCPSWLSSTDADRE